MLVISRFLAYMCKFPDCINIRPAKTTPFILPVYNTHLDPLVNVFCVVPYIVVWGVSTVSEDVVNRDIFISNMAGVGDPGLADAGAGA